MKTKEVIFEFDKELINTYLKSEYIVFDEDGAYRIRYAKGEKSIKIDEQTEFAKPERLFIGYKRQGFKDPMEIKFIKSLPFYGKKVRIYDPTLEHKENMDAIRKFSDVLQSIMKLEDEQVRLVGYIAFGNQALKMDINDCKSKIVKLAQDDINKTEKILSEKDNTDRALIALAMVKDVIYEADGGNSVKFTDTDELITSVRKGEKPEDAIIDFFKSSEGKETKKRIAIKIKEQVVESSVETALEQIEESKPEPVAKKSSVEIPVNDSVDKALPTKRTRS